LLLLILALSKEGGSSSSSLIKLLFFFFIGVFFWGVCFCLFLGVSDFCLFSRCKCVCVCVFWGSFGSGIILLLGILEFSGFCSYNTRLCFFHCVHNVLVWVLGGFEER
jgi:hypothetical protein